MRAYQKVAVSQVAYMLRVLLCARVLLTGVSSNEPVNQPRLWVLTREPES